MTSFPITGPINLDARLLHGSVTVRAIDDLPEAVVNLRPQVGSEEFAERIAVEMRGHTLTVHSPRHGGLAAKRDHRRSRVDADITVPSGTALKLTTHTATITVSGRAGGSEVVSARGNIRLETVDGDLRLRYGSAQSVVGSVTGSVRVHSGRGDLSFGEVGGALDAAIGSGRLAVSVSRGPVRAKTGSGTAVVGAAYADVDVACGSGAITIGVPQGISARLDAMSGSGTVSSEMPVQEQQSGAGPAITVRARTGSGDLTLVRSAPASVPTD